MTPTPDKQIEVANHLRDKHGLTVDPDAGMTLTLLCLIIDRLAPQDEPLVDQIESLVLELQERNRGDLGVLAGQKTEQANELRSEFQIQAGLTRSAIDRLSKAMAESGAVNLEDRRRKEKHLNLILITITGWMTIITTLLILSM